MKGLSTEMKAFIVLTDMTQWYYCSMQIQSFVNLREYAIDNI